MTRIWHLRAAVVSLLGVVAVHQGRYLLAPQAHDHALAPVHEYLTWLTPLAGASLFLTAVHLLASLRHPSGRGTPALPPAGRLWAAATATLICVFAVQESAEWALVHGSLPTPVELAGHGGWAVLALTVAVGGLIALVLKGAARVVRWALRRRTPTRRTPVALRRPRAPRLARPASVIARFLAGRAPPAGAG